MIINNLQKYYRFERYSPPITSPKSVRLNLNENLFGPSPSCRKVFENISLKDLCYYDLMEEDFLVKRISHVFSIQESNIFLHNGSSEIIRQILGMALKEGDIVLLPELSWSYYTSVSDAIGATVRRYKLKKELEYYNYSEKDLIDSIKENQPRVVVITSPNMPTGNAIAESMLRNVISQFRDVLFIVDQAYWGYADVDYNINAIISACTNVVFVRTFSKFFGLASERVGFCICNSLLRELLSVELPLFRVSFTSRKLADAALSDMEYYNNMKNEVNRQKEILYAALNEVQDITVFKSEANFVFCEIRREEINSAISEFNEIGYCVRVFPRNVYHYIRITIGTKEVMENVIRVFKKYFS